MPTTVSRINITLPSDLLSELKENVPRASRSRLIAKALAEKLRAIKRERMLAELRGSWEKGAGVSFSSNKELANWRSRLWTSFDRKLAKKGGVSR